MATSPDPACRDGALAVRIAEDAARRSARREPMVLEALAAALAESDRFEEAARVATEALALAVALGRDDVAARLREAGPVYASRQPYRSAGGR